MGSANTQAPRGKALPDLSMLQVLIVPETCKLSMPPLLIQKKRPLHHQRKRREQQLLRNGRVDKVPPLAPMAEGGDRKEPQIAYARTLLTVFQEAVNQMATVVENLEQIQTEGVAEVGASSTKEVA